MQIFIFWFQVIFCLNLYSDCMRGQNQFIDKQEEDTKNILGQIQLVKFRQSKNKRKPIPVEKEKLYDENYQLRNRIKELQEMNLRLRTRLTVAQKQKEQIFSKAQQQHSSPQVPKRSHSGMYKMSHPAPFDGKNNITLQKQKHNQVFKKLIRDKDFEIERLRMELQSLKKTMKFTRLNELRYQNDELIEQTKRLRSIIEDNRSANDKYSNQYLRENDQLRRLLQNEEQKQKKNGNALKKKIQEMNQLKQRMRDCQLRKVQMEKRLNKDIKALKAEQLQLKSKLNQDLYLSKQCTKQECNKAKKERADYKKKVEQLQKQLKGVKQQLVGQRKRIVQKQVHYQKLLTQEKQKSNSTKRQLPSKQIPAIIHNDTFTKRDNIELIKKQQKQSIDLKQDASHQKETNSLPSKSLIQDKADTKITEDKVSPKVNNFHQAKPQTSKLSFDKSNKNEQSTVLHQVKGQQSMKKPTEQAYDSDNTEKLLESSSQIQASPVEQKKDKKATLQKDKKAAIQKNKKATLQNDNKIQNSLQVKEKRKTSKNVDKQLQEYQQFNQQFNQDEEQYQKIEFDEQQVKPQKNKVNQSQEVKQKKKKKENSKKKLKNDEKAPKSKKKQEKKIESDEELLYQKQQKAQNDPTKLQLKEIRQTLTYKFIAQRCDYETFVQIIKARNQKVLSVQEVMNILQDQPCILDEKDIQIVTIYCFQTESFTGQQALPVKDFLKKMKKFVGKIKLPSQEEESENVEQLIHFIYEDQSGKKILRKQFGKIDSGDGMVGKQQFISVLKGAKIGSKLIQTALAQIVYVSQDINHLNYVLFLNRFVEEVEKTA